MKKSDIVRAEMVLVSPELAQEWLDKNLVDNDEKQSNRKLRPSVVGKYKYRMQHGEWNECNGETLKFDRNGNFIDGQHRLTAQIEAGISLHHLVAYNCSERAFATVDNGANRKAPDMLSIHGETHCNILAAVLGLMYKYNNGIMSSGRIYAMSNEMIVQMMTNEDAASIRTSVSLAATIRHETPKGYLAPSIAAFIHYNAKRSKAGGDEKATAFLRGVCLQEPCEGDQPIRVLRMRLMQNLAATKRADRRAVIAWCVKAWNAFATGATVKKTGLRYKVKATRDMDGKVISPAAVFPTFVR